MNEDVAAFRFEKGTLTLLSPVSGIVTGAVFVGEGRFNLKPVTRLDAREIERRRIGAAEVSEEFTEVVFRFTADGQQKFLSGLGDKAETPADTVAVFAHWKEKMRQRH